MGGRWKESSIWQDTLGGNVNPPQICQESRPVIQVRNFWLASHTFLAVNTTPYTDRKEVSAAPLTWRKPAMYITRHKAIEQQQPAYRSPQADGVAYNWIFFKKKTPHLTKKYPHIHAKGADLRRLLGTLEHVKKVRKMCSVLASNKKESSD